MLIKEKEQASDTLVSILTMAIACEDFNTNCNVPQPLQTVTVPIFFRKKEG
jgi:hypothetical protein